MNISILGGGNMARAIAGGLVSHGYLPSAITVVDRNADKLERLAHDYGIHTNTEAKAVIRDADVIILAIKPQGLSTLLTEIGTDIIAYQPLVLSIMSGIRLLRLAQLLPNVPIIRVMPNTPTRVNAGMTLLCAQDNVSAEHLSVAQDLFAALGRTYVTATERVFEQLTALTGCGPAFVFYMVQALSEAMQAIAPGLDVLPLTTQTFAGAIALMQTEQADPVTLIAQVAPKGGMTEQSMKVLYDAHLQAIFQNTLGAAITRGDELAEI